MDLLALISTVRRHKLIVILVLLLAAGGEAFVLFGIPPQYESKAQYVLINPPAAPTDTEIQRDPGLARLNHDNPYLRLPNPSVVTDVLAQRVGAEGQRRTLRRDGADPDYEIAPTNALGSGLVIEITGTGRSSSQARRTVALVSERMTSELHAMQIVNGADDQFLIKALPVSPATDPERKVTSTVRSLIAVAAAAIVLLFAFVSVAEAIPPRRTKTVQPQEAMRTLSEDTVRIRTNVQPAKPVKPARPVRGTGPTAPPAEPKRDRFTDSDSDITILLPRLHESDSHDAVATHPPTEH
jgi:hypothetical protein